MSKECILIADNNKPSAEKARKLLEACDYDADVVSSGAEVLEKAIYRPSLILLSRQLPDINALELCQQIRKNSQTNQIPIIIFAAQNTSSERAEGLSLGADDYICGPISDEELVARIQAVLRRIEFFRRDTEEKGALATELKQLLSEGGITTYFQPIYSMKTLKPIGLEALSRPSTKGLIDNAEFLFRTALILDMYSEVEIVCWKKAADQWTKKINKGKLFLNCTPYFIETGRINKKLIERLDISPKNIVLEVTERTAIQKEDVFLKQLELLRGLGFQIAVDDVGSGFASLDMVVTIKPDIVKIDRKLIHEVHKDEMRRNVTQAIISFCKKSHIMTIAEGIEEERELEVVNDLGIDAIQGYLMAMPAPEIDPDIFTRKFGS